MYGLSATTNLEFIAGAQIIELFEGDYVTIMRLSGGVEVTADCAVSVDGRRFDDARSAGPIIRTLLRQTVQRAFVRNHGDLVLSMGANKEIVFHDSNHDFESYTVSSPQGTIVV